MSDLSVAFIVLIPSIYTTQENYNPLYVKISSLVSDNNGNQIITVVFGGAPSGIYNVSIVSKSYGSLDSSSISLQTIGEVTSYSPN